MKTMTCNQFGGACSLEFRASTFEAIAELSKQHGMEMHKTQDARRKTQIT
jgi:hypothetical protein